jgi:hypothetical protein
MTEQETMNDEWVEVAMIVADRYARALRDFEPVEAKEARAFLLDHIRARMALGAVTGLRKLADESMAKAESLYSRSAASRPDQSPLE